MCVRNTLNRAKFVPCVSFYFKRMQYCASICLVSLTVCKFYQQIFLYAHTCPINLQLSQRTHSYAKIKNDLLTCLLRQSLLPFETYIYNSKLNCTVTAPSLHEEEWLHFCLRFNRFLRVNALIYFHCPLSPIRREWVAMMHVLPALSGIPFTFIDRKS